MIDVGVVDPAVVIAQHRRRWHDDPPPTTLVQSADRLGADGVVGMGGVALVVHEDDVGAGEGGDDVHVTARAEGSVFARQAALNPDDVPRSDGPCQFLLARPN